MNIVLPKLNEMGEAAGIDEVLVAVGDLVQPGQAVVNVEMQKAVVPIESPFQGKVSKINVAQGDEVATGSVLIELEPC